MSQFGGNNWWQGLQGLFGGQQQASGGHPGGYAETGWRNAQGFPVLGSSYFNRPGEGELRHRSSQYVGMGGDRPNMTYGQALVGALGRDYENAERARQQELAMYQGLFGNLMGSMQGAGQMVQGAREAGQQNMAMMQQQADQMRRAAAEGNRYFEQARGQMMGSLDEARRRMDEGIGTMRGARSSFDATRRDDTASEVLGIQSQYKNQLDQIARRDDLTAEQKDMMSGELKQSMRQQSAGLAAQADARARDTLLAIDQNIAQMQTAAGAQLGQFGIGVGQTIGQLGAQTAAMRQQAEEQIGNFYNNMAQFNSSLLQSAQASALQYVLNGNQMAANIISSQPFGPLSMFETLVRAVDVSGANRRDYMTPGMTNLFGSLR